MYVCVFIQSIHIHTYTQNTIMHTHTHTSNIHIYVPAGYLTGLTLPKTLHSPSHATQGRDQIDWIPPIAPPIQMDICTRDQLWQVSSEQVPVRVCVCVCVCACTNVYECERAWLHVRLDVAAL